MIKICVLVLLFNYIQSVPVPSDPVPASVDWRKNGVILPVPKRDDSLRSSIVNLLDGISANYAIGTKQSPIKLSRQQIYDCSSDAQHWCPGHKSGNASDVIQLICDLGGKITGKLDSEETYPYTGKCENTCPTIGASLVFGCNYGWSPSDFSMEKWMDQQLTSGPVVTSINANTDKFKTYSGGIFDDKDCSSYVGHLNHTLLVVGYDSENGINYWIARNNWGTNWGEEGYIRVIRGKDMCGIGRGIVMPF